MRGEEQPAQAATGCKPELPPHARRRGKIKRALLAITGITSACAEKSLFWVSVRAWLRNYLRMRGEELYPSRISLIFWELPPHARRRDGDECYEFSVHGITSACAEKRIQLRVFKFHFRNYLRMRGEELAIVLVSAVITGITSACAEKRLRYLRKL